MCIQIVIYCRALPASVTVSRLALHPCHGAWPVCNSFLHSDSAYNTLKSGMTRQHARQIVPRVHQSMPVTAPPRNDSSDDESGDAPVACPEGCNEDSCSCEDSVGSDHDAAGTHSCSDHLVRVGVCHAAGAARVAVARLRRGHAVRAG